MLFRDVKIIPSAEGNVSKYVFTAETGVAEAVLYRYPDYQTRTVICCSTMSGCPVGCRFCGAGDYFVRSMSAEEIVAQADRCIADTGIDAAEMKRLQIMFMSMGEPLLNPKGMQGALRELYGRLLWRHTDALRKGDEPRREKLFAAIEILRGEYPAECQVWDDRYDPAIRALADGGGSE